MDGRVVVDVVDDDELDYGEDELVERGGLEYEYVLAIQASKQRRVVFSKTATLEAVIEVLSAVGSDELVRVYRSNSPIG